MNPIALWLLAAAGVLGLAWGLRRLLESTEASLALLLTWPTTTRAAWLEEKLHP